MRLRAVLRIVAIGVAISFAAAIAAPAEYKYPVEAVPQVGHGGPTAVAISPSGRFAISGGYRTLVLWDLPSRKEMRTFLGHTGFIYAIAFSPDGRFALSGDTDQTLKLWDLAAGREQRSLGQTGGWIYSVAFSRMDVLRYLEADRLEADLISIR